MEATLDRFGRVLIPKRVRDHLGLTPGAILRIEEVGQEILLRPACEEPPVVDRDGVLVYTGEATGNVVVSVHRGREDRLDHLADMTKK